MNSRLSNHFASLGTQFSLPALPAKPAQPKSLLWNQKLAEELGIQDSNHATYFSGQQLINGSNPVAMTYAGHQFGHFNPQLGDGRAHLLGEVTDSAGMLHEIQLKGSGQTPFSRNGDGKCGIKPAVREFIMSESMYALKVPTTRCLAVITTGESISRETSTPGAVVTRIADSHLRVGTFEYFAARKMHDEITIISDFFIQRHCPNIAIADNTKYIKLLSYVIDKQIELVVEWMRVGFIHGVMNTDNTLLCGKTIDYGPCAMLGIYDPDTVFSSIDRNGRYAFKNQPIITQWNMARLAECILPLVDGDEKIAVEKIMPLINAFTDKYNQAFDAMMNLKLGLQPKPTEDNKKLHQNLLNLMFKQQMDYTQTFVVLNKSLTDPEVVNTFSPSLKDWHLQWLQELNKNNNDLKSASSIMTENNPVVIPRNHHIEAVLEEVESSLSAEAANRFLDVLQTPYSTNKNTHKYQDAAIDGDLNYQTFCGT